MRRAAGFLAILVITTSAACARRPLGPVEAKPKAFGTALVTVSGEKQAAAAGNPLADPLVVQVNDAQKVAVAGALVRFSGSGGMSFTPDWGLTGPDGQIATNVTLGDESGHYQVVISTPTPSGAATEIRVDEIALGYREVLGEKIDEIHCIRCHDTESTAERVSNHDNLTARAHAFTDGATLNPMSDQDLAAIIGHGGRALNKSAEMPPYGNTLTKSDIDALIAYLRTVSDPPYHSQGVSYATK